MMEVTEHLPKIGKCVDGEKTECKAIDGPNCADCVWTFKKNGGCTWWKECEGDKPERDDCNNPGQFFEDEVCTSEAHQVCQGYAAKACGIDLSDDGGHGNGNGSGENNGDEDEEEVCEWDSKKQSVRKPSGDSCALPTQVGTNCGAGFMTMNVFFGESCDDETKIISTSCSHLDGATC